jgi:hypothetical protein
VAGYVRGRLAVETAGPEWRAELEKLAPLIMNELHRMLPAIPLSGVVVRHRPAWASAPLPAAQRSTPAPVAEPSRAMSAASAHISDPELRAHCLRTAGAYLARQRDGS